MGTYLEGGKGEKVLIWGDSLIPSSSNHKVNSPVIVLDPEATVSTLIDQSSGWWNYAMIKDFLVKEKLI